MNGQTTFISYYLFQNLYQGVSLLDICHTIMHVQWKKISGKFAFMKQQVHAVIQLAATYRGGFKPNFQELMYSSLFRMHSSSKCFEHRKNVSLSDTAGLFNLMLAIHLDLVCTSCGEANRATCSSQLADARGVLLQPAATHLLGIFCKWQIIQIIIIIIKYTVDDFLFGLFHFSPFIQRL